VHSPCVFVLLTNKQFINHFYFHSLEYSTCIFSSSHVQSLAYWFYHFVCFTYVRFSGNIFFISRSNPKIGHANKKKRYKALNSRPKYPSKSEWNVVDIHIYISFLGFLFKYPYQIGYGITMWRGHWSIARPNHP